MTAQQYMAIYSTPQEIKKWNEDLNKRIVNKETGEDIRSLTTIALDWFADNEKKIRHEDPGGIKEACMFFMRFYEDLTPPPWQMRDNMTKKNFQDMIEYLNKEIEKKNKIDDEPK